MAEGLKLDRAEAVRKLLFDHLIEAICVTDLLIQMGFTFNEVAPTIASEERLICVVVNTLRRNPIAVTIATLPIEVSVDDALSALTTCISDFAHSSLYQQLLIWNRFSIGLWHAGLLMFLKVHGVKPLRPQSFILAEAYPVRPAWPETMGVA